MNRIFKKVFNRKIGEYVVASEAAKGNKKSTTGSKATVVLLASLISGNSISASFNDDNIYAGVNGTTIGKGNAFEIPNYSDLRRGWTVGGNQWYANTNSIGTNELNTAEQRAAGFLQGTIDNYSKNIGQANAVNQQLALISQNFWDFEIHNLSQKFQDYYLLSPPNFMSGFNSMNSGYDEMYQHMMNSNINDILNQSIPSTNYTHNSQPYLSNTATSFGGNNIFKVDSLGSYDLSINERSTVVGRDNGLNANSTDTTVVGHNNTLDVINVIDESEQLYGFMHENDASETNPIYTTTFTEYFNRILNPISNAYTAGLQTTVVGNNTVNNGVNNIIIGSTTSDRTSEVLASRQAFLDSLLEIQTRTTQHTTEATNAVETLVNTEFNSDEEYDVAYRSILDQYMPITNALRLEHAQLLKSFMDKSSSLAAGVTGNDSVSIGVNAKTISAEDAWWNDLVAKTELALDNLTTDIVYDDEGNMISSSNQALDEVVFQREYLEANTDTTYQDRTAHNQLAVGFNATSSHVNAVAIGKDASTTEENSIAFGMNRVTNVGMAIDGTDAMTVGNLKALEGQFDYNEIIYQPYQEKVLNREHVQADVVQRSINYGIQKDIIMNNQLTAYLKDKTDKFIGETVATNSAIIETEVANFTANEISKGKELIDSTINSINQLYANTKDQFANKSQDATAQNLIGFTADANANLDDAAKKSVDDTNDLLTDTTGKLQSELVSANEKLGLELDQIADYEDEATDKRILAELIYKTEGKNLGNGDGTTGGDGGSENANGMTDAFEDALDHLQAKDQELKGQLLDGFNNSLANANNDFDNQVQDLDIQDQLLANKDAIQAEAIQKGLDMLDAKDSATQLEVLNTTHELAKQSVSGVLSQTQQFNNTIQQNVVESAINKDAGIAQDLLASAASKDKEILDEVAVRATEADLAVETAVKTAVEKADAETLANVADHTQKLNAITKSSSETYASEQDKLVYNRMLEVLSAAPTSSISNVWKNINEGDQVVFDQSLEYIDSKDAETLAKAKDYADQKANSIDKAFNTQTKRLEAGVASAVAASMLGQSYVPGAHTLGVSVGVYGSEIGYAVGASTMSYDSKAVLKAGFTVNSKNRFGFMSGAGFYID